MNPSLFLIYEKNIKNRKLYKHFIKFANFGEESFRSFSKSDKILQKSLEWLTPK